MELCHQASKCRFNFLNVTYKTNFNVISERRSAGKPIIHVFSDVQPEGFTSVEPDLEDVYFSEIFGKGRAVLV